MLESRTTTSLDHATEIVPPGARHAGPERPTQISLSERWLADGALLLTTILWGINIPVVKFATTNISPLVFNASRVVLSTVVLGGLVWIESRVTKQPLARFSPVRYVCFALLAGLLYPLLFMWGIDRTSAGNTALLLSTMPLWTAVVSALFIGERLPLLTWLSLAMAFAGTAIIVVSGGKVSLSASSFIGDMLILLAALVWASGTVVSGPLLKQVSALRLAFFASLLTTPLHLLIVHRSLLAEIPKFAEPATLWALIYSGAFSTGIAYATWHMGVRRLGGSHAAIYQNVVTLVAVLGGWLALGEPVLMSQILGGILMIGGLLMMRASRTKGAWPNRKAKLHS